MKKNHHFYYIIIKLIFFLIKLKIRIKIFKKCKKKQTVNDILKIFFRSIFVLNSKFKYHIIYNCKG